MLSLASTIVGLILAGQLYEVGSYLFRPFVSTTAANLLGFITIFLIVLVVGSLLTRLLRGGLKRIKAGWVDKALGAGFGLLRGWLVCSVVYLGLTAFPIRIAAVRDASFGPALATGTEVLAYLTSKEMRERFEGFITVSGKK